jgi:hypothetical protein
MYERYWVDIICIGLLMLGLLGMYVFIPRVRALIKESFNLKRINVDTYEIRDDETGEIRYVTKEELEGLQSKGQIVNE